MRNLVRSLPPPNRETMEALFSHLRRYVFILHACIYIFFINITACLSISFVQGYSTWWWEQDDCAERGYRFRPNVTQTGGGDGKHRHLHGLPEPDRRILTQWIWVDLPHVIDMNLHWIQNPLKCWRWPQSSERDSMWQICEGKTPNGTFCSRLWIEMLQKSRTVASMINILISLKRFTWAV